MNSKFAVFTASELNSAKNPKIEHMKVAMSLGFTVIVVSSRPRLGPADTQWLHLVDLGNIMVNTNARPGVQSIDVQLDQWYEVYTKLGLANEWEDFAEAYQARAKLRTLNIGLGSDFRVPQHRLKHQQTPLSQAI